MADFSNGIVTNAGAAAEATANANGWTIQFTRVQVGSGTGASDSTTLKALTALRSPVTLVSPDPSAPNANLIGINNLVTYQVAVRFEVNSAWVTTQFQLTEAGLFAKLNNGSEFLYAYAYAGATGDIITNSGSGSPVDNQYTFVIPYSNAPTISVTLGVYPTVNLHAATHLDNGTDPIPLPSTTRSGLAPANPNDASKVLIGSNPIDWSHVPYHEATHLDNGSDPLPYPSTTRSGVVLANPNDVNQVYCGSDPPSWQPGMLRLSQNAILYVATTGNDSTAIVNDITHPWATIQGALNWLSKYFIQSGVTATISVAAGVYNTSSTITVNHPQGSQILIVGTLGVSKTITGSSISGASVTLTAAAGTFSDMAVGDYFAFSSGASIYAMLASGICKATAVAGNGSSITYSNGYGTPSGYVNFTAGTVIPLKTVLLFSSGINGIVIKGNGVNQFNNFAIVGTPSGSTIIIGVTCTGPITSSFTHVGFYTWNETGVRVSNALLATLGAVVTLSSCYANLCGRAISAINGGNISATGCFSNANYVGYVCASSIFNLSTCYAAGNALWGLNASLGAYVNMVFCFAIYNASIGVVLFNNSTIAWSDNFIQLNGLGVGLYRLCLATRESGGVNTIDSVNFGSYNVLQPDGSYANGP